MKNMNIIIIFFRDIKLSMVIADAIRLAGEKQQKVWMVVGTDGTDYIDVVMWGQAVDKGLREMGTDYLVGYGSFFLIF